MSLTVEDSVPGEDGIECPICSEIDAVAQVLPCGHKLCVACLKNLSKSAQSGEIIPCPLCRNQFSISNSGSPTLVETCNHSSGACGATADRGSSKEKNFLTKTGNNYCLIHLDKYLYMYCQKCSEPGCADCFIDRHQHQPGDVIKIELASERLRLKLRNHVSEISDRLSTYSDIASEIDEAWRNALKYFENMKDQVAETSDALHETVKDHADELNASLSTLKQEKFSEYDHAKSLTEQRMLELKEFLQNCDKIARDGTIFDVVHEFEALDAAAVRLNSIPLVTITKNLECLFVPAKVKSYLPHTVKNVVGYIHATKEDLSGDPVVTWNELNKRETRSDEVKKARKHENRGFQLSVIMIVMAFISLQVLQGVRMYYIDLEHDRLQSLIRQRQVLSNMTRLATTPVKASSGVYEGMIIKVTWLKNLMFVAGRNGYDEQHKTWIKVYIAPTYGHSTQIIQFEYSFSDMSSDSTFNSLYLVLQERRIIKRFSFSVHDVSVNTATRTSWSVSHIPTSVSVSMSGNVLVTFHFINTVREYTPDGLLVRDIPLQSDVNLLSQFIELDIDRFLVVDRLQGSTLRRLCVVNDKGIASHCDSSYYGYGDVHVAVNGFIFVADSYRDRILLLSSTLKYVRDVVTNVNMPEVVSVSDDGYLCVASHSKFSLYHFE